MKHGKKPTREQRKLIERHGIDSHLWLVVKDTPSEMVIVHRLNESNTKTLFKTCKAVGV